MSDEQTRDEREALSDARMEKLRADVEGMREYAEHGARMTVDWHVRRMSELLADNDRRRAELAAARELVRALASVSDLGECLFPGCKEHVYVRQHAPDCPVTQARALLAREEGEAQS